MSHVQRLDAVHVAVRAGENRGPARRAERIRSEAVVEAPPRSAISSMRGVRLTTDPYAPIAWAAWSSVSMRRDVRTPRCPIVRGGFAMHAHSSDHKRDLMEILATCAHLSDSFAHIHVIIR